jgi:mono/diheme cytochrome c family protein
MTRTNMMLCAVTAVMVGCLPDYPSDEQEGRRTPYSPPSPPSSGASGPSLQPAFGETVRQEEPPPPLSGGTLAVAPDGHVVVAADPDRDVVYVTDVDASSSSNVRTVALLPRDEPGRVVIDGAGRAHVALRKGGAIVSIDLATASVIERRAVCSAPRGIAYDPRGDVVHVACAEGELVTLPAAGGAEVKRRRLPLDLRDVVVLPSGLAVSTFREAKILELDANDLITERRVARSSTFGERRVAWRMIAAPPTDSIGPAEVMLAAQKAPETGPDVVVPPSPSAYYQAVEVCSPNGPGPIVVDREESVHVPAAVLPVDVAATSDWIVLAAAGNGHTPSLPQLVFLLRTAPKSGARFACSEGRPVPVKNAQITSVALARGGAVVVALSREPAAMIVFDPRSARELSRVALSTVSREDTGHAIFHSNSGVGVACASCHPDGRDDGHSWRSLDLGPRRTPSLRGTLAGTAPYHWNGEAKDLSALARLTFQSRMRGPALSDAGVDAMNGWLASLAAMPSRKAADVAAEGRGKALFEGAGNCTQCHSGAMLTNNETVDAHTGGLYQVPSLVGVSWRTPLLHDGRIDSIGALLMGGHGEGHLEPGQVADLTTYVEGL